MPSWNREKSSRRRREQRGKGGSTPKDCSGNHRSSLHHRGRGIGSCLVQHSVDDLGGACFYEWCMVKRYPKFNWRYHKSYFQNETSYLETLLGTTPRLKLFDATNVIQRLGYVDLPCGVTFRDTSTCISSIHFSNSLPILSFNTSTLFVYRAFDWARQYSNLLPCYSFLSFRVRY